MRAGAGLAAVNWSNIAAAIGAASVLAGAWFGTRGTRESDRNQRRLESLDDMRSTVEAFRSQVELLEGELEKAEATIRRINTELDAARANVLVLSEHVRRYIPEIPFPKLRRMNAL